MTIDEKLYVLPGIGRLVRRLYAYFRQHVFFTDMVHIASGLGIGFLLVGGKYFIAGIVTLGIGTAGHLFAFVMSPIRE